MLTKGIMPIKSSATNTYAHPWYQANIVVILILTLTLGIMPIKSSATNTYVHSRYQANKE